MTFDWIADVSRRLTVTIEIVDSNRLPVLPEPPDAAGRALRHALFAGDGPLRGAIATATPNGDPVATAIEGMHTMSFGLAGGAVLVVASHASPGAEEQLHDLRAIGSWLREPVETGLTRSAEVNVEPYRMASLGRILDEAAARGSARTVLGAFVEAVGVWDEVLGFAYASDTNGGFVRYASPRGVSTAAAPDALEPIGVRASNRVVRLSADDTNRLQIDGGNAHVFAATLETGEDLEWLLLFIGAVDEHERVRLMVYVGILRDALSTTLAAAEQRLAASIAVRTPLSADEPIDVAARDFLARLANHVSSDRCALAMSLSTGRQLFAAGAIELLDAEGGLAERLLVTSQDDHSLMMFAAARPRPAFLGLDRHMARVALAAVQRWLDAHVGVSLPFERRGQASRLDSAFERIARNVVRSGQHVTVAVVSLGPDALRPGALHEQVNRIRDHIRLSDVAGAVSATEVAVLLPEVESPEAERLSVRLRELLRAKDADQRSLFPLVGVTTWSPNGDVDGSIIATARASLQPAI